MTGLFPHADLAVRAGSLAHDRLEVLDLLPRAECVDHIVDELEELNGKVPHRHLGLLAEVDELGIHPAAHRPPLVLLDEARKVASEALILVAEHQELCADRLDERGKTERLLDTRRGIADAELDRGKERVRPQIRPDLPAVVDGSGLDEELDEILVLVIAREVRRSAGAGETTPDHLPVRLQASVSSEPERG